MWPVDGVHTYFVFKVLPFGLSTACHFFTKLFRPLIKYWRGHGYKVVVYLDHGICSVHADQAVAASQFIQDSLAAAGFLAHPVKSHWEPSFQICWLGFDIDLSKSQIMVPDVKIKPLRELVSSAVTKVVLPARHIARVVGKIISLSIAVGPVSRLMTRSLYAVLNNRDFWSDFLSLTPDALSELSFWQSNLEEYNCQPLWREPGAVRVVYSDASDTGFGGYVVEHGHYVAHGQWDVTEAQQSSTWRELRAVRMVFESLIPKLRNCRVKWLTDNLNVSRILEIGSKTRVEALLIF